MPPRHPSRHKGSPFKITTLKFRSHPSGLSRNLLGHIYYDNGQIQLTKILIAIFASLLDKPDFRVIMPNNYKLFQVADLICTLSLIKNKIVSGKKLTHSEQIFFGSEGKLRKNYLKFFERIEFNNKFKQLL